jgi:hypothetical protein
MVEVGNEIVAAVALDIRNAYGTVNGFALNRSDSDDRVEHLSIIVQYEAMISDSATGRQTKAKSNRFQ